MTNTRSMRFARLILPLLAIFVGALAFADRRSVPPDAFAGTDRVARLVESLESGLVISNVNEGPAGVQEPGRPTFEVITTFSFQKSLFRGFQRGPRIALRQVP